MTNPLRVYLNGQMLDAAEARISPFDRGFLFGDGVYEGIRFFGGRGVGMRQHIERLRRSLEAIRITGFDAASIEGITERVIDELGSGDAMLYIQVTRGTEIPRRHAPGRGLEPTVFSFATPAPAISDLNEPLLRRISLQPDLRWKRCDIKSVNLLGNVLALDEAVRHGFHEAVMVRNGLVSEGSMTTVFAVDGRVLLTPPVDVEPSILHGVTRHMILELAEDLGLTTAVRPIPSDSLLEADEVFIASSSRLIDAVVGVDDRTIGQGTPGDVTTSLLLALRDRIAAELGLALRSSR